MVYARTSVQNGWHDLVDVRHVPSVHGQAEQDGQLLEELHDLQLANLDLVVAHCGGGDQDVLDLFNERHEGQDFREVFDCWCGIEIHGDGNGWIQNGRGHEPSGSWWRYDFMDGSDGNRVGWRLRFPHFGDFAGKFCHLSHHGLKFRSKVDVCARWSLDDLWLFA